MPAFASEAPSDFRKDGTEPKRRSPLSRLREITSMINSGGGLQAMLERVLVSVCNAEPWSRGGIMAVNRSSGYSELVASFTPGERTREPITTRWALATSPVLRVVESRQPMVIADAQVADEFAAYQADAIAREYRTVVLVPLGCTTAAEHELVLSIHTADVVEVSEAEIDFLTTVAHVVATAVEKLKHLLQEQRQTERLRRVLEAGSNLMELVLDGASLTVTAGVIGAILPDPFVILDLVSQTCITRRSPVPDALTEGEWRALVEGGALPLLAALADRVGAASTTGDGLLELNSVGVPLTLPVLTESLRVDGETVGALLIFPRNRLLDSLDRVVTQEVRFALSAQIMRHHAEAKREAQDLSAVFEQLCQTGAADPAAATARARRQGIDIARPIRLLAVRLPPVPSQRGGERNAAALRQLLAQVLPRVVPGALVIEQGGLVAIGWPLRSPEAPLPSTLLDRHVMQPIRSRWGAQPTVAEGPVCIEPGDYQAAWAECGRALHLARMFKRDGLVRQSDFGAFALLLSALDGEAVQGFVDAIVGPVRRHDADHASEFMDTITIFIDEACRYQTTAERLGIHVSTLRHRLRRIQELFGMDLEDAETRFRASLATRLLEAGSARRGPAG